MKQYTATITYVFETDDDLTDHEIEFLSEELFTHAGDFTPSNMDIEIASTETSKIKRKHNHKEKLND